MAEYATLAELRAWGSETLSEERSLLKSAAERSPAGSTFLSHSSKDVEYLAGVIRILSNHGARVYIDKKDESLPPFTSRETAKKLRERIVQCEKFILFATSKSKDSKWMPWELGISDGLKRQQSIAVFPGVDSIADTKWADREYLGVYDRVAWGKFEDEEKPVWMVLNQEKNTASKYGWFSTKRKILRVNYLTGCLVNSTFSAFLLE